MKVVYNHLQVQAAKGRWIPAVGIFFEENDLPDGAVGPGGEDTWFLLIISVHSSSTGGWKR